MDRRLMSKSALTRARRLFTDFPIRNRHANKRRYYRDHHPAWQATGQR